MSQVNITLNTNTVDINTTNNQIVVTDPTNPTTVNITQPVTSIVEVITAGPQGPPGPSGSAGPSGSSGSTVNTGSLLTTASFNTYTGSTTSQFAGTASYATQALSASFAISSSRAVSSSFATTASNALTASYVNPLNQKVIITGSVSQGAAGNIASGISSHAEGDQTISSGTNSHAEGVGTTASGYGSHAEGRTTQSSGDYSHAEGENTISQGEFSHTEGYYTTASGNYSHAEGNGTTALGEASHAEGDSTKATGENSHAEGTSTLASGVASHAEGASTLASGVASHAEGASTLTGYKLFIDGTTDDGGGIAVSGDFTPYFQGNNTPIIILSDDWIYQGTFGMAHAIYNAGNNTTTFQIDGWDNSYVGYFISTTYGGNYSHAEGTETTAQGSYSHAEGASTQATGFASHAEGAATLASGYYSHAEGGYTIASGDYSHAEGSSTLASGSYSHAEGGYTIASGDYSHAEGYGSIASGSYQHVQGQFNIPSLAQSAFIHGNGTADNARSNLIFASGSQVQVTGSLIISGSITGSLFGTASYSTQALSASFAVSSSRAVTSSFATTASYVLQAVSASFATTASFAPLYLPLTGGTINGNVTVNGTASIAFLNVQYESASVIYSSGSNVFGDATNDTQTLNGTVIVSGSQQITGSLNVSAGITGSLFGTASYASNGGVTQLLAGSNISLSPTTGVGQVTISSTGGGGGFNTATGSYGSFYDTTIQTNVAGTARSMSLNTTDITNGVSVSGSTNPFNTYIKTENAGVYDIQFSAQVDKTDSGTDEIWIWLRKNGTDLTDTATSVQLTGNGAHYVAAWNFFVNSAANDYYQLMWYSPDANVRLHAEPAFGVVPGIPSLIVTVNRVDQFLSNTGSFSGSFTGQFTGSLFGTASFATTASYVQNAQSASYVLQAVSSSFATTASYALNAGGGGVSKGLVQAFSLGLQNIF
jgi:hypothetical protein